VYQSLDGLREFVPLLIPILLIQLGLMIAALLDLSKRATTTRAPKWLWVVIIVAFNFIGPIAYFFLEREGG